MAKYNWTPCPYCRMGQLSCKNKRYECNRCGVHPTGQQVHDKLAEIEKWEGGPKSHLELKVFDPETD